jgi:type VI secretion system protein ImpB
MPESTQKKLERVRPPKVQISYEVETGNAIVKKELAFVTGVIADLSGDNEVKDKKGRSIKITDRKFSEINRDNFNSVLEGCKPRATFRVDDRLSGESGKQLSVDLEFTHISDFHPEKIAEKIEPLRKLVEARRRLASLKRQMDGNTDLENSLNEILKNVDLRQQVKASLDEGEKKPENS